MRRKFYIRKTPQDALDEQTELLKKLLSQQEENARAYAEHRPEREYRTVQVTEQAPAADETLDVFVDGMFIPKAPDSSSSLSVESTKVNLDMDDVGKLKKARSRKGGKKQ